MRKRTGHIYKRGGTYWLRYTINGVRTRQSLKTSKLRDAEKEAAKIMGPITAADDAEAARSLYDRYTRAKDTAAQLDDELNPPLALSAAWDQYLSASNRPDSSERTLEGYGSAWKRFQNWLSKEHPGITLMRDVSEDTAGEYAAHLVAAKLTPSTYNQHTGLLRLVWRVLQKAIRGTGNPWQSIQKRKTKKLDHRRRTITPEQFRALLAAAPDADLHDLLFTLGWTGQRLVDGVMLKWDEIDFTRRVITLYPRKTLRTGKAVHVPLLPQLAALLEARKVNQGSVWVFPELVEAYNRDNSALSKRIKAVFEAAGMTASKHKAGVKRAVVQFGAHSFRHHFATQALAAGVPAEIVKRITGHSSDAMLEGYEHIDAAMIGNLAAKIAGEAQPVGLPAGDTREHLPPWAVELIRGMTSKNWRKLQAQLLSPS